MKELNLNELYILSLERLFKKHKFKNGLEIGLEVGSSTRCFLDNTDGELTSIDIENNKTDISDKRWKFILGDSKIEVPKLNNKYDFIYIDGDHLYDGVTEDINNCWPLLQRKGIMLLDDYGIKNLYEVKHEVKRAVDYWNQDMKLEMHYLEGNPNGAIYFIKE
jgi:predicted O-methyltransferase YrrM